MITRILFSLANNKISKHASISIRWENYPINSEILLALDGTGTEMATLFLPVVDLMHHWCWCDGPVAQWLRRPTSNRKIAGSTPARVVLFLSFCLCQRKQTRYTRNWFLFVVCWTPTKKLFREKDFFKCYSWWEKEGDVSSGYRLWSLNVIDFTGVLWYLVAWWWDNCTSSSAKSTKLETHQIYSRIRWTKNHRLTRYKVNHFSSMNSWGIWD